MSSLTLCFNTTVYSLLRTMESCLNYKPERVGSVTVEDLRKDLFPEFSKIPPSQVTLQCIQDHNPISLTSFRVNVLPCFYFIIYLGVYMVVVYAINSRNQPYVSHCPCRNLYLGRRNTCRFTCGYALWLPQRVNLVNHRCVYSSQDWRVSKKISWMDEWSISDEWLWLIVMF